jgi:hypothetical protein
MKGGVCFVQNERAKNRSRICENDGKADRSRESV